MTISHELLIVATGAAPFAEVDVAIPLGIGFGFTAFKAYILAVIGNILPLLPLLWFWRHGVDFLSKKSTYARKIFDWGFTHTRARHGKRVEAVGLAALVVLLALPIPFAGAWTMTVLAFLFDFPFWKSFFAIVLGVVLGAAVVLGITMGAFHLL